MPTLIKGPKLRNITGYGVYSIAEYADGRVLLGGSMTKWGDVTLGHFVRLKATGEIDLSFKPVANNNVGAIGIQSNKQVIIGGSFTTINTIAAPKIARLNLDATLDTTFMSNIGTGPNYDVTQIFVQTDQKILVRGYFTSWNGVTRNNIVRLNSDGTIDSTFASNVGTASTSISCVYLQSDGKILIGQSANTPWNGVTLTAARLRRLNSDGTLDSTFMTNIGTGVGSDIYDIIQQPNGKIVLTGYFGQINGSTANYIGRLNSDGTFDTTFTAANNLGPNRLIEKLAVGPDNKLIVLGSFSSWAGVSLYAGGVGVYSASVWASSVIRLNDNGSRDTSFEPWHSATVQYASVDAGRAYTLKLSSSGKLLIGGEFTKDTGTKADYFVRLSSNGSVDETYPLGWTELSELKVKVSGVWKSANQAYSKVSGVWKKTLDVTPIPIDYVIIGGAAGGGYQQTGLAANGGGGAGGYLSGSKTLKTGDKLNVVIGAGGTYFNGGNFSYVKLTPYLPYLPEYQVANSSYLGGQMADRSESHWQTWYWFALGSSPGMGAYFDMNNFSFYPQGYANRYNSQQGNAGGECFMPDWYYGTTGGGGGKGGVGTTPASYTSPANGGPGVASSITGTSVYRAAGGGGGAFWNPFDGIASGAGAGGNGGGGNGGGYPRGNGGNGAANTGSGGGGGGSAGDEYTMCGVPGNGGSGVFILRYPNTLPDIQSIGAGLQYTRTTPTGYKVYQFTGGTGEVIL